MFHPTLSRYPYTPLSVRVSPKDPFVKLFVRRPARRSPVIHRGYFARWAALQQLVDQFLSVNGSAHNEDKARAPHPPIFKFVAVPSPLTHHASIGLLAALGLSGEKNVIRQIEKIFPEDGLVPMFISIDSGEPTSSHITFGSMGENLVHLPWHGMASCLFPTLFPIRFLTLFPIRFLTLFPIRFPTLFPIRFLTLFPIRFLTLFPIRFLTLFPICFLTLFPIGFLTLFPICFLTLFPIRFPTLFPIRFPTRFPIRFPTRFPTLFPTLPPPSSFYDFYEYLIKMWVHGGKTECLVPPSSPLPHTTPHLSSPALHTASTKASPADAAKYLDLAKELTRTCYEFYNSTPSKLAGEDYNFHADGPHLQGRGPHLQGRVYNILRPEAVEAIWYSWRATKDPVCREWGWQIWQAFEKHCRVEAGYVGLEDAGKNPPPQDNMQQSFFLAETLKYLYLLFSPDDTLNLDKWVINTEAHPLKITPRHTDFVPAGAGAAGAGAGGAAGGAAGGGAAGAAGAAAGADGAAAGGGRGSAIKKVTDGAAAGLNLEEDDAGVDEAALDEADAAAAALADVADAAAAGIGAGDAGSAGSVGGGGGGDAAAAGGGRESISGAGEVKQRVEPKEDAGVDSAAGLDAGQR
ncbi:unnamed protein product [Closterium sp. Naga37s-1]|nr:unnamed protein product [Closterium sp. Naga37s-1]